MIIFLYGLDSYRIGQKITEIISSYKAKNPSGLNFVKLDFAENNINDFYETVIFDSFIPEKKLIIIKSVFRADSEALLKFFQPKAGPPLAEKSTNLSERDDIILVIIHFGNPLKSKLFEYLTGKPNQAQNFKLLKEYEIKNWARKFLNSFKIELAGDAMDFLISNSGNDLWKLDGEIRKIAAYKIQGIVTVSQVEELIAPGRDYNIFELTDALAKKNKSKALSALHRALDSGEKPTELIGLLGWQVRNLLRFKSSPNAKPSDLKLHPFVLEKLKSSAKFFSVDELNKIMSKIINLDFAFKTSDLDEKTALSLLISEL